MFAIARTAMSLCIRISIQTHMCTRVQACTGLYTNSSYTAQHSRAEQSWTQRVGDTDLSNAREWVWESTCHTNQSTAKTSWGYVCAPVWVMNVFYGVLLLHSFPYNCGTCYRFFFVCSFSVRVFCCRGGWFFFSMRVFYVLVHRIYDENFSTRALFCDASLCRPLTYALHA